MALFKCFQSVKIATSLGVVASLFAVQLAAQTDEYGDAFTHYQPYVTPAKKTPKPAVTNPVVATSPKKDQKQKVDVAWLRENYPKLEERAINEPTKDNLSAYLYTKRIVMDKSQRFASAALDLLNEDPILNENNRIPYASGGAQAVRNADARAQLNATEEMAKTGGLVVFVDGSCRFCTMQMPVLQSLKNNTGLEYLVVSVDGTKPANFKGDVQKDNGLFGKLGLKLTPSIVFVNRPKGYANGNDPNTYHIVAQGFYAADELTKQLAYAGFKNKLLAQSTLRALDIWNVGVATVDDLSKLQLDPNQPASFKDKLQPLLLKQYKQE